MDDTLARVADRVAEPFPSDLDWTSPPFASLLAHADLPR
jgi:hypothetical protein